MKDPHQALTFALEKYPQRVSTVPLDQLMLDSARGNDKRPAYVKLAVPDETVKALRGPADKSKDLLLLVSVPKDILERSDSRIILPGEV